MGEHHLLAFYPITTSLQNTLWNQFGNHENRRLEFLQSWDCAKEDLLAVEEALGDQVNDAYIPEDAEYATHGVEVARDCVHRTRGAVGLVLRAAVTRAASVEAPLWAGPALHVTRGVHPRGGRRHGRV